MSNRFFDLIKAFLAIFESTTLGIIKLVATAALPVTMRYYFDSTTTPKFWDPGTPYWIHSFVIFVFLLLIPVIDLINDCRHVHQKFKINKKTGVVCDPDNQIPQVTLRCATVRKILHSVPADQLRNTGLNIGCDFVRNISGLNKLNEARIKHGQKRSHKSLQALLKIWANYDSETGMGLVSLEANAIPHSGNLEVKCTWDSAFTGNKEEGLCDFLEGYCFGCIKSLVNSTAVSLSNRQEEGTRLIYYYSVPA